MITSPTAPAEQPVSASVQGVVSLVRTFAHVSASVAQIDVLRRDPELLKPRDLPASFLKHADEQAVCALAAVVQAIRSTGQPVEVFSGWSVLGAPRYPGRTLGGASIMRFFDEGIRGISPHIIPQNSTHSISGLLSVGLGMGGPNLGAGGGAQALEEGLVTALAFLSEKRVPGMWFVATGWTPEPIPQKNGRYVAEGQCHALALALEPGQRGAAGLRLELRSARSAVRGSSAKVDAPPESASLQALAAALERQAEAAADGVRWKHDLGWGAELALIRKQSS